MLQVIIMKSLILVFISTDSASKKKNTSIKRAVIAQY